MIFYILDLFPGTALYEVYKKAAGVTDDIWLDRIEDILYFETDPNLDREQVLSFGRKLRQCFFEGLPDAVAAVELEDREDLFGLHADFLSRLALTFDHGDYAGIEAIPNRTSIAENLYRKALTYYPDQRAYLGLGIILQKGGRPGDSRKILEEGVRHFPQNEHLNICLGVSLMNQGRFEKALAVMRPFEHSRQALGYIAECYKALDDHETAARFRGKMTM